MKDLNNSTLLIDSLYSQVEKSLKTKSNQYHSEIARFIDARSDVLFLPGPSKRLYFSDAERDKYFKILNITPEQVDEIIKQSEVIDTHWQVLNDPFKFACVLAIRYFHLNKKKKELQSAVTILALSIYSSLQFKYFKYEPNENIMNYTINNLSNKFKIKQLGNVFKAILYTAMVNHETYSKNIEEGTDILLKNYISGLNTRLNGFLKKISNEFYENRDKGLYLNTEEDNYEEENYHIADNNSFLITRTADAATLKMTTRGLDIKLVKIAANMSQISVTALRNAIVSIIDEQDQDIREMMTLILQLYLSEGNNSPERIRSTHFINFCLEIYIKSNTNDESILRIKELLDQWLTKCSPNYNKTERIATKNGFRKALYLYFVFIIQQSYAHR